MTRKGFTLIELLVVVLIMGILASVAMPQYYKSVEKSRSAEAIATLNAAHSVYQRLFLEKGRNISKQQLIDELKIDSTTLNYFIPIVNNQSYIVMGNAPTDTVNIIFRTHRNTAVGGGLGKYAITLRGNALGQKMWQCSPTSAGCNSFLPK